LAKFLAPDPDSRTRDDEGRRIEEIDGGWSLLNHGKYRALCSKDDAKEAEATRKARYRAKVARNNPHLSRDVPDKSEDVPESADIAEADAHSEAESESREREADKPPTRSPAAKPEIPSQADWLAHRASAFPSWPVNDALAAWSFYEGNGWRTGRNPVKKWRACAQTCFLRWQKQHQPAAEPVRIGKAY
jgi:hypothetical protein